MRKIAVLVVLLLIYPWITAAQPVPDLSVCAYKETREKVPINPKTKKPYKRNEEPFSEPSITRDEIKQCLRANMNIPEDERIPITNHHIVFEDYRDAWQELAKETGDYAIPLLIFGGVLHANTPYHSRKNTGGIRLWEFRDPTIIQMLRH